MRTALRRLLDQNAIVESGDKHVSVIGIWQGEYFYQWLVTGYPCIPNMCVHQ